MEEAVEHADVQAIRASRVFAGQTNILRKTSLHMEFLPSSQQSPPPRVIVTWQSAMDFLQVFHLRLRLQKEGFLSISRWLLYGH